MININLYTSDTYFKDSIKKLVGNAQKSGKIEGEIRIQIVTEQKKKIVWSLNNNTYIKSINIYLLDISDNYNDGIELAREIRKSSPLAYIVFISNDNCRAEDLIRHGIKAYDYFCKPVGTFEFTEMINDIVSDTIQITRIREENYSGYISVISDYRISTISLCDIIAVEYSKPKARIITTYGEIEVCKSLQDIYDLIAKEDRIGTIVRTHKSYVANLTHVDYYDMKNLELVMSKGIKVPIARTRKKEIIAALEAVSAAICAAYGVDFLEPLNPREPAEHQLNAFPLISVRVTNVLLKVDWMWAWPFSIFLRSFFLAFCFRL